MKPGKLKRLLFWGLLLVIILSVLEGIGYIGMWANSRSFDFLGNKSYFQIRGMLIGDKTPEHFPHYLSLPHLGYIQYPGYKKYGIVQNNEDGYRGEKVPLQKGGKLRILCMGGSTTYGFTVDSPCQAYPARLEVLLNSYFHQDSVLAKRYKGVEVINAGLESGTSAEELQQYLFKYRYYKPDVVIVHSGVNDAELVAHANHDFQLDYEDSRRLNFHLEPLPPGTRWLLNSYFISFMSINLFYSDFSSNNENGTNCFSRSENQQFCNWSHVEMDSIIERAQYQYYPFYRNSKSLFESVIEDSAQLIIFPNALNKRSEFVISHKKYDDLNSLNASISKSLSEECSALYVPFTFDSIADPECWVDDCHLNSKGEKNKAEILFRAVVEKLKDKTRN
jgi:lysophospholipase L1-like esterase